MTLALKTIHALQASKLPYHHKDPFERMIIAQAQVESLSLLTVDRVFQAVNSLRIIKQLQLFLTS